MCLDSPKLPSKRWGISQPSVADSFLIVQTCLVHYKKQYQLWLLSDKKSYHLLFKIFKGRFPSSERCNFIIIATLISVHTLIIVSFIITVICVPNLLVIWRWWACCWRFHNLGLLAKSLPFGCLQYLELLTLCMLILLFISAKIGHYHLDNHLAVNDSFDELEDFS